MLLACVLLVVVTLAASGCTLQNKKKEKEWGRELVDTAEWLRDIGPVSSGKYFSVVVDDFDGDGNLDLAAGAEHPKGVVVWYGTGDGRFVDYHSLEAKGDVKGLAVGDFDSDGLKDLAVAIGGQGTGMLIWTQQPDRTWEQADSISDLNRFSGVETADVNGDGHIDVIAANSTSDAQGGVQVWMGDGKGEWYLESGPVNINRFTHAALADFDEDGRLDIVAGGTGAYGALRVWLGDGTGGWSASPSLAEGDFFRVTPADINGDGHQDILAGTYKQGIRVFWGDGKGEFVTGISPDTEGGYWKAVVSDINGDGRMDITASSVDGEGVKAWLQLENHRWQQVFERFPDKGVYYDILLADMDKDQRPDMCAANWGEGVKIWPGAAIVGGATTIPRTTKPVPQRPSVPQIITENKVFTTINGVAEYRVGPRDILDITMWRGLEASHEEVSVQPDGTISFALLDSLDVKGLTPGQIDRLLTEKLKRFMRSPRISVNVERHRSKSFSLLGAIRVHATRVSGPGVYSLSGKTSIIEAIARYGGPRDDADMRKVTLQRPGGQVFVLDLYKAIVLGDRSQDAFLDDGDVVFVPTLSRTKKRVYVLGEVKSPGVYPFDEEINVLEALLGAGGLTDYARSSSTKIIRGDISKPEIHSVDVEALLKKADRSQNMLLASKDVIYVPRTTIGDVNAFIKKISPMLNFLLYPARVRDTYMYNDALRLDIGGEDAPDNTVVITNP
ncbi:MAG: FG-GAP-like repeat-containing protein [Desulfatibacillaceae bacterium]